MNAPVIHHEGFSFPTWLGIREVHRSRARSAWHQARQLRKFVAEHDWHMSDDDVRASLGMAADLRRETYEHLLAAKTITPAKLSTRSRKVIESERRMWSPRLAEIAGDDMEGDA